MIGYSEFIKTLIEHYPEKEIELRGNGENRSLNMDSVLRPGTILYSTQFKWSTFKYCFNGRWYVTSNGVTGVGKSLHLAHQDHDNTTQLHKG